MVKSKSYKRRLQRKPRRENLGRDLLGLGVGMVVLGAGLNAMKGSN